MPPHAGMNRLVFGPDAGWHARPPALPNWPYADEVCRCGHGRSVHRTLRPESCSACRAAIDAGLSPPSGKRCVEFAA
jgi:hypothetical protein